MPGGAILDVAIGLFFMYLLLSMISTVVQEAVANVLRLRANNLYKGIENLLKDKTYTGLAEAVYDHPAVKALYRRSRTTDKPVRKPSYIPSETFAVALLDTIRRRAKNGDGAAPSEMPDLGIDELFNAADEIVGSMTPGDLKTQLTLLVGDLKADADDVAKRVEKAKERLRTWFDLSMDRVSGWYKRKAQAIAIALGILIAALTNSDSLYVSHRLWADEALRTAAAEAASTYVEEAPVDAAEPPSEAGAAPASYDAGETLELITDSRLPVGWIFLGQTGDDPKPATPSSDGGTGETGRADPSASEHGPSLMGTFALQPRQHWVMAVFGWIVTGFAVSLGASFWFNTLGQALKLRGSGTQVLTGTVVGAGRSQGRNRDRNRARRTT